MSLSEALKKSTTSNHVIVTARAGTGKTTTLIEGLKILKGQNPSINPSAQQQEIWDEILKSEGAGNVAFCCFNKSIQQELERKVPEGVQAMTMHSMGFRAVQSMFGKIKPDGQRVDGLISRILGIDIWDVRKKHYEALSGTKKLVGLCKQNLLEGTEENLWKLVNYYEVDLEKEQKTIFDLVPQVMEECKKVDEDKMCDFDDMIWLPVAMGLAVPKFELLLVDEAQDLNRCQQALARMASHRLIMIGDPMQAIYGFAGADAESMPRMLEELSNTESGCVSLTLNKTYRCGKAIVEEAKKIVPDFVADDSNSEGTITEKYYESEGKNSYRSQAEDGDMVLCRVNAPLVTECFRFLREGRKAIIRGRDIGKGLIQLINKVKKKNNLTDSSPSQNTAIALSNWINDEIEKEGKKKFPSEIRVANLQDKEATLSCFLENVANLGELVEMIEKIFSDKQTRGIQLSSIHKAKGLESNRVFLLCHKDAPLPHPMASTSWAQEQEMNLKYVAITRAIDELVWVS